MVMIKAFFDFDLFIVKLLVLFVKVMSKTVKSQKYMATNILNLAYLQSSLRKKLNEVNQQKGFQRLLKYVRPENKTPWTRIRIIYETCETEDFFPGNC